MTDRYPKSWRTIDAPACRERAGNRCESCGVPGTDGHHRVFAFWEVVFGIVDVTKWKAFPSMRQATIDRVRNEIAMSRVSAVSITFTDPIEVILHSHHKDGNKANVARENLICLCPRCHRGEHE